MSSEPSTSPGVSRSIGQVLAALKADFPDISISKIRFLESEGLIAPERAASGYRRYAEHDLERLRYVLAVQRDHYLPLKVIKEHLALMDRGEAPPPVPGLDPRAAGRGSPPSAWPAGGAPEPSEETGGGLSPRSIAARCSLMTLSGR